MSVVGQPPLLEYTVPAGTHWSGLSRRGAVLRLTDVDGGANCAVIFFNPEQTLERYNMPDTLKAQHTGRITRGHCLYSDMGRIFCSVVADTLGWRDPLYGVVDAATARGKYGESHYQQQRNDMGRNGRDSLLVEIAKYGLGKRDLFPNINFFMNVPVTPEGELNFVDGISAPGKYVEMRAEMDVVCVISNCPQLNNPCNAYNPTPVRLLVWNPR